MMISKNWQQERSNTHMLIQIELTNEEIYAITTGLRMFMYENKYLNEDGYKVADSALTKILENV
jgi:hypothetical protein